MPNTISPAQGGALESSATQSYNSMSGADIKACIGQLEFANLQAVSYTVTREKAPIYCLGSPDPRSFSRNKRGVGGSLVWVNFDRHSLLDVIYQSAGQFVAWKDDVRPEYVNTASSLLNQTAIFNSSLVRDFGPPATATIDQLDQIVVTGVSSLKELASPWYADQILPFDITLAATNEMGAASAMRIFGVEILNEATGSSIEDSVSESSATFVARLVEPWAAVQSPFASGVGGADFSA
jgi:hypothetical protein